MNNSAEISTREDRLVALIEYLKENRIIFNDSDFANSVGKSRSYISEAKGSKRTITEQFAQQIERSFPVISSTWLLTGEGEMLRSKEPIQGAGADEASREAELIGLRAQMELLKEQLREKDRRIEELIAQVAELLRLTAQS